MSWSMSASSTDKAELKRKIDETQYCPDAVKEAAKNLVDAEPEGCVIDISIYGHHGDTGVFGGTIQFSASLVSTSG